MKEDQIQEVMGMIDELATNCIAAGIAKMAGSGSAKEAIRSDVRTSYAAIETKLSELLPGWQLIESAPTKEEILLLSDEGIYQGKWSDKDSFEPLTLDWHGCGCCGEGRPKPTHWMPLPKAPE